MVYSTVIIFLVILLDRISKYFAVQYLKPVKSVPIIKEVINLTYLENKGAAFGMLSDRRWIFMTLSVIMIIAIFVIMIINRKKIPFWTNLGLCFALGGGIGNMIDRIFLGYVVDFVDFTLIDFAIFNVADSFVCIGVAILAIDILFGKGKTLFDDKKSKEEK